MKHIDTINELRVCNKCHDNLISTNEPNSPISVKIKAKESNLISYGDIYDTSKNENISNKKNDFGILHNDHHKSTDYKEIDIERPSISIRLSPNASKHDNLDMNIMTDIRHRNNTIIGNTTIVTPQMLYQRRSSLNRRRESNITDGLGNIAI